jgi:transposase
LLSADILALRPHSKPVTGSRIVYIGQFDLPPSHQAPDRHAPCPCCSPRSPKFSRNGKIAWFPDEHVIRMIGPECFQTLNPEGHWEAVAQFDREEAARRTINYLTANLHLSGDAVEVVENSYPTLEAIDNVHATLQNRMPLLLGKAWRSDGVTRLGHVIHLWRPQLQGASMNIRYRVDLSQTERDQLHALLSNGKHPARRIKRAQILLAADTGVGDEVIAASVSVGGSTVYRTRRRFVEGNLDAALSEEPRPGTGRKLSGKEEAILVATACAKPPEGRARWTLTLLAGEMVRLTGHEALSRETVRRRLAENELKPWRKDMWCIPQVDGTFVARMEDVLDLYAEAADPKYPVVCFDESPAQLVGEVRQPIPPAPGQRERYDYEYRRNGTANLFVFLDAHRPWRTVKVTDRRTAHDFAVCMRDLVDVHYPKAELVRVVLDNLSTHSAGALYEAFPAPEAHRVLRRLEFHHTPKHASWLNMVEIEIGVLRGQCLDRRIGERHRLVAEIAAWERRRNAERARVKWMFSTERARTKLAAAYPVPGKES